MNPAYMIRDLHEHFHYFYGVVGHLTSNRLIRAENKADEWETDALYQFENGTSEVSGISKINTKEYFRFMRPLIIEKSCLKCHIHQGYKIGDLRGGLSVSIPMEIFQANTNKHKLWVIAINLIVWLLGLFGIHISFIIITKHFKNQITTENKLSEALKNSKISDQRKSRFVANVSHEIRTPMNGIMGFTSLLLEESIPQEEKKHFIHIIEKNGRNLLDIVNDLTNISKIESGQMEVFTSSFNLYEELVDLVLFYTPEAKEKGLQLSLQEINKEEEWHIKQDKNKLTAIFTNLIKNAIKYTPSGSIDISLKQDNGEITCCISDTGIGIPKEKLDFIFGRFTQVEIEDRNTYEGAGLGLSITKAYGELLKGEIWAHSEEGKGSQFYFSFPKEYYR
ncbi:MAG: hypothetical protein B7C24_08590 [Bacteroidetes bacterium 4572_77]|nr:MAG: hypothetical protein B7C24_08590 [Bacteroidetes bacterium 4572_77]